MRRWFSTCTDYGLIRELFIDTSMAIRVTMKHPHKTSKAKPRHLSVSYIIGVTAMAVLLLLSKANAQVNSLKFSHLSVDQGLSHADVYAIMQDSKGFIWLGTKNGLNLYDGYTVQTYKQDVKDKSTLPGNDIRALAEDNEGYIWAGTYDSGLIRLNRHTKKGQVFTSSNTKALTSNSIYAIHKDRKGNIWVGTFGGGLVKFDAKTQQATAFRNRYGNKQSISSDNILAIHEDRQGKLWLGTFGGGLCKFDPEKGVFSASSLKNDTDIYAITEDRKGHLWLGTYGKGLIRLHKETGAAEFFSSQSSKGFSGDYIRAVKEDAMGILWIGTEKGGGLKYFDPYQRQFHTYRHEPTNPSSLGSDNINALLLDKSGSLWIAAEGSGVDRFDTQNSAFRTYVSGFNAPQFTTGAVNALYEDSERVLWIGGTFTDGLTLYAYDRSRNTYASHRLPVRSDFPGFNYSITAIAGDDLGNIWIGTAENGLYRYNQQRRDFKVFTNLNSGLSSNGIETIYKDRKGVVWIGTYEGGLCRLDPDRESFRTYSHRAGNPASLGNNTVKVIYEDKNDLLWLGSKDGGLCRFDRKTDSFKTYKSIQGVRSTQGIAKSLPSNSIRAIVESQGDLWIGTDAGICKFQPATETFARINERNGLPENDVCAMLTDNKGNLWISTFSKGIVRFNAKTHQIRYFTTGEGLHSNEFTQWAAHKNRNGELFFGGSQHFISLPPEQIIDVQYTPPVYLTSFSFFDQDKNQKRTFAEPVEKMKTIELNYSDNFFEFEFTFLNYINADKNTFAYMMEGVDKNWKSVGDRRLASYTNIDPGEYVFKVKAADKFGRWSDKDASVRIVIQPAWYDTWLARLTATVLVISSIWLYYRNRIRFFQRQKETLERQVRERTVELVQKNAEIEAQKDDIEEKNIRMMEAKELIEQINEELKATNNDLEYRVEQRTMQVRNANQSLIKTNQELDMFIYRASHDIKGPLASLAGLCKVALMDVKDAQALDYFSMLDRTCEKANHTLVRILRMYDIRSHEIQNEPILVANIIQEYVADLRALPQYAGIAYESTLNDTSKVFSDHTLLQTVLTNVLENAFRYYNERAKPYVKVEMNETAEDIHVFVRDNGTGIAESQYPKLFTMFFRGTLNASGTGLGLYLAKIALERLGGSITFRPDFSQETVFEIRIPKMPPAPDDLPLPLLASDEPQLAVEMK